MSKCAIYLTQVDILRKTPNFYTAYLPYTIGDLWAYAKQSPVVDGAYEMKELFFLRDPVDEVVSRMENPFLVGFSCYVWNTEYNKVLARAVKKAFPNCYILFGGHNVPPGGAMLEEEPYIDFLLHGEGEIPFQTLLTELCNESPELATVPGLSYRTGQTALTNESTVAESVEDFPSPYLEGVFDSIIAAHPEIQWSTVWETNRGCPHHCVYCDWGQHEAMVREFPMERLIAEIAWMSENKVEYVWCADANFGILERDEEILDALAAERERTGYPYAFISQTTKTLNDRLFRIIEKLIKSGLDSLGPNLALQSLSPDVLRNIGRKNIDDATFSRWIRRYREAGCRTHTDLILGLPGETLRSFCSGVEKLFTLGQHDGIQYFTCAMLPNSLMATPAYHEKHKIRTARKIFKQINECMSETEQIDEYMYVVDETASMSHADWLTANYFMFLTQGMHGYGMLRLIAIFLHTERIVRYSVFYLRLLAFCHEYVSSLPGEIMAVIEKNLLDVMQSKESEPLQVPGFSFGRMYEEQYIFSRAVLEPDRFYDDVRPFLEQFGLEGGLFEQLLRYQRESILMPGADREKIREFEYDFPAYFSAIYDGASVCLQRRAVRLRFFTAFDISSAKNYYEHIVTHGRFSSNAFFQTEYTIF